MMYWNNSIVTIKHLSLDNNPPPQLYKHISICFYSECHQVPLLS